MKVRLFIKPYCSWCDEAIDWLDEHGVAYETLDVISDAKAKAEMFSPTWRIRAIKICKCLQIKAWFS